MTERLPPLPEPLGPEERALAARLARLGPHGEPSPALDARILAAARAGIAGPANPARKPARWPWAFGIAASVALAVGLAWQLRPLPAPVTYDEAASAVDTGASASMEIQATDAAAAPTAAPAEPAPSLPAANDAAPVAFQRAAEPARDTAAEKPRPSDTDAADAGGPPKARTLQAPVPVAPPAPPPAPVVQAPAAVAPEAAAEMALPAPPPAAPATSASKVATQAAPTQAAAREAAVRDAAQRRERNAAAAAEVRAAESAQDSFAEEPFVEDIPPATADSPEVREAWLYRIRELRDAGRREEARESLMEYVARYPRHDIPDDLEPLLD